MNYFKTTWVLLSIIALVGTTSCKKNCDAPSLETNIIGTWDVDSGGEVTFNADGTYTDNQGSLLSVGDNTGTYNRTYSVDGLFLSIDVEETDGGGSAGIELPATKNECDEIVLGALIFTVTLTRK